MKPLIYSAIIVVALILGKIFFFSNKPESGSKPKGTAAAPKPSGEKLKIFVVNLEDNDNEILAAGTTVAQDFVEIRPEISGLITKLNIPEGKVVGKGFLIAKIKDDDILAQLKKIGLEEELAKQTEARHKKLLDINAISKEEYDISLNKVYTLRADKDLLKVQLARTEIRAPFAGRVGLKNISVGTYVTPATVVSSITQTNPIRVDFTTPERYLSAVRVGNTVNFTTDGSADMHTAKIVAIDPSIDPTLRTLKVRALAANSNNSLIPGMFVNINMNLKHTKSIMIPTEAIIPVVDGMQVYVKRNGLAEVVKIETGHRDVSKIEVLKGLNVGDSLITSGLINIKPGMSVASN